MKYTKLFAISLFLLVILASFASAKETPVELNRLNLPNLGTVREIPLNTCNGQAELYLYEGLQTQEPDVLFTVDRDELLIFTKGNRVSDLEINLEKPEVAFEETDNLYVKVYKTEIDTPGGIVYADVTSSQAARGVQAYLAQDSANPVYDPTKLNIVYDDDKENVVYMQPGTYQYFFLDKYDKYSNGVDSDDRELTITVTGPTGIVSQQTYTKPSPTGTQGAVVHEFTVTEAAYYTVSVSTEDSIWWALFTCHPPREDHCKDAEFVVSTQMWVTGDGCHHSGQTQDTILIDIPETKKYYVTGSVYRGNADQCQPSEEFYVEMNGQTGPVVEDEADPCSPPMTTEEYLGTFDLEAGQEMLYMNTAAKCPPDTSANSVDLTQICFYDDEEIPEFGAIAASIALIGAVAGFFIFRRKH